VKQFQWRRLGPAPSRFVLGFVLGLALQILLASVAGAAESTPGWDPQQVGSAAEAVEEAAQAVLHTLRVVPIPAEMPYRMQMLSDVVSDAEEIQRESRSLVKELADGKSREQTKRSFHRIAESFPDLKANTRLLAPPEELTQNVATLGAAVERLAQFYAGAAATD